ncbi:MAG: leucine-rich repeat domain-containing protein, partial [Kiritimatiellae bacterium]|nr:leucine-rich repeat domain-containing protein [Kiritimatiellia bacterium]
IPDCVRHIRGSAFYGCTSLTDVTLPDSVMDIEGKAFYNCRSLTELEIPDSVERIEHEAFYCCSGLSSIEIGYGVSELHDNAFGSCSNLKSVTFKGNAPEVYSAFENVSENCVAYVLPNSTGWGVSAGEKWNGLTLMYWYYAGFPLVEHDSDIRVALAGAADGRLAGMITNVVEYYAYWDWAHSVKNRIGQLLESSEVKSSPHAAAAYLLGAEELFDNEPTIVITGVEMGDGAASASFLNRNGLLLADAQKRVPPACMTVSVVVKDGERVVAVDASKVAAMFEATSDLGDWNGAAKLTPTVQVLEGDGATMRFRVTPGDGTATRAFLRIRR